MNSLKSNTIFITLPDSLQLSIKRKFSNNLAASKVLDLDLSKYQPMLDDLTDRTIPNNFSEKDIEKYTAKIDLNTSYKKESKFSEDLGISLDAFKNLNKRLVILNSTALMRTNGKVRRMVAWVIVGNRNGFAGYGEGVAEDPLKSIQLATSRAIKNGVYIERYDQRSICHDIEHQDESTKIRFFSRPPGFGLKTHPIILEICQCIGIRDMAAKIVCGSTTPSKIITTTFNALLSQRTPEMIAKGRGKILREVKYTYYGVQDPH